MSFLLPNRRLSGYAYIFDLDGTLFDSYRVIVDCLHELAVRTGYDKTPDEIRKMVISESVTFFMNKLCEATGIDDDRISDEYRQISHGRTEEIILMPGAKKLLRHLKMSGARLFVYTHRGTSTVPVLKNLGIYKFFDEIVTSRSGFKRKPAPDGVNYLVDKYRLDKSKTFYVGDRWLDVLCGKNAGVRSIFYLPADSCAEKTGQEEFVVSELTDIAKLVF